MERLSTFHHFRYRSNGPTIHFIHERGQGPAPIPIILTHGWPGSFLEMLQIIPMLTHPANYGADLKDSFDVVVPSMPGYGFSDRPLKPGMNTLIAMIAAALGSLGCNLFSPKGEILAPA